MKSENKQSVNKSTSHREDEQRIYRWSNKSDDSDEDHEGFEDDDDDDDDDDDVDD